MSAECKHTCMFLSMNGTTLECLGCGYSIKLPKPNYNLSKIHTTIEPTEHCRKVYDIEELDDGSYIYTKKRKRRK